MTAALQMSTHSAPILPEASVQTELLGDLVALARRLDELPKSPLDETAAGRSTVELARIVQSALSTVTALERLDSTERRGPTSDQDWEPQTWVSVRTTSTAAHWRL